MADTISPQQRAIIKQAIDALGLGELWSVVDGYLSDGWEDADQILKQIQLDPVYQDRLYARFPALKNIDEENRRRAARGEPPLQTPSPRQYVEMERGYANVLRDVPGNWATRENITEWISNGLSVEQVDARISTAENYINYNVNPEVRQQLREIYGLTDMEMVSYVLSDDTNKERLNAQWEQRLRQANTGAAARSVGLGISGGLRDEIASSSDSTYTFGQAAATFRNVAEQAAAYRSLGDISGVVTDTDDLIRDEFNLKGAVGAREKKKRLASQERARFSKSSGLSRGSLSSGGLGSQ